MVSSKMVSEVSSSCIGRYRVYFKDTDVGGVMYHARYVDFLEMARTDYLTCCGYSIRGFLEKKGIVFPVVRLDIKYYRPAYLDDVLEVRLKVDGVSGAKIFFSYKVYNQDQVLLGEASTVNAVVDREKQMPLRAVSVIPAVVNSVRKISGRRD